MLSAACFAMAIFGVVDEQQAMDVQAMRSAVWYLVSDIISVEECEGRF